MSKICESCGEQIPDDSAFCSKCGFKINDKHKVSGNKIFPILIIASIVIGILECLTAPVLIGYDLIAVTAAFIIIGGILGYYLLYKKQESFISSIEFIVTAVVIYLLIGRFGEISAFLFVATAIVSLYLNGREYKNKKLIAIPVVTLILPILILVIIGMSYGIMSANAVHVGNVTNNIVYDFGSYSGSIDGDVHLDSSFDFLTLKVDYIDSNGKIIDTSYGWSEVNPKSGHTYKFSAYYYSDYKPELAKITVTDDNDNILYNGNITLS